MPDTRFYETIVNGYRLTTPLGSGGMGDVYLGVHVGTGHKVAIKILNNPEYEQRFQNEMAVLSRIEHPAITAFHAIGKVGDHTCIIMEYANGVTLHDLIRQNGKLNYEQAKGIFQQILQGVGYVHHNNIIHRDIKPGNIKVDEAGQVKILDFGIAKADFSEQLTRTGEAIGTFQYMSPEQLSGKPDKRSDIWSLGITFYEMLTGYLPFNSKELYTLKEQIRKGQYTPVTTLNGTVPPHIEKVIARCLQLKPEHRYQSVQELLSDLDNLASGKTTMFGKPAPPRTQQIEPPLETPSSYPHEVLHNPAPRPNPAERRPMRFAVIAAAVLAVIGLAWWLIPSGGQLAADEVMIEFDSTIRPATISVDNGKRHKLPYEVKRKIGQRINVVVEAIGHKPNHQSFVVSSPRFMPGKHNPTVYINPK